jgi:hypothetical protein
MASKPRVSQDQGPEQKLFVHLMEPLASHRFDDGDEQNEVGVTVAHLLTLRIQRLGWEVGDELFADDVKKFVDA